MLCLFLCRRGKHLQHQPQPSITPFHLLYFPSPFPLCQPPSFRVMELPTQKQDMVYKWDAGRERSYFSLLKVMGPVLQNYSWGEPSHSFTGKSNHPKQGAGEGKKTTEERSLWRAGKTAQREGWWEWWVTEEEEEETLPVTLFYLMLEVNK